MILAMVEAALRAGVLAIAVWFTMLALRVRSAQVQRGAWLALLAVALAMPLLMKASVPVPTDVRAIPWIVDLTSSLPSPEDSGAAWPGLVLGILLVVATTLLVRQGLGLVRWWKVRRLAQPLRSALIPGLDVRVSPAVSAPATVFSTVLVPQDFEHMAPSTQRTVIAHERAHVQNGDFYVQCLAQLHRSLFWFSPLAWWLPKKLSLLSEYLSDDAALAELDECTAYAEVLLAFAARTMRTDEVVAMARTTTLAERIERILHADRPLRDGWMKTLSLAALLLSVIVMVAGFQSAGASGDIVLPRSDPGRPLSQPIYPVVSRRLQEQGTVVLKLHVLEDGSVADSVIDKSSGYPSLDYSAMYESFRWRLEPGSVDGAPLRMWGRFAVTFKVTD